MSVEIIQAILALDNKAQVSVTNIDSIKWWDGNPNNITKEQIQAKFNELVEADTKNQYQRDRAESYDPIPEQLDQLFHQGYDGWKAEVQKVKDQFPKP